MGYQAKNFPLRCDVQAACGVLLLRQPCNEVFHIKEHSRQGSQQLVLGVAERILVVWRKLMTMIFTSSSGNRDNPIKDIVEDSLARSLPGNKHTHTTARMEDGGETTIPLPTFKSFFFFFFWVQRRQQQKDGLSPPLVIFEIARPPLSLLYLFPSSLKCILYMNNKDTKGLLLFVIIYYDVESICMCII